MYMYMHAGVHTCTHTLILHVKRFLCSFHTALLLGLAVSVSEAPLHGLVPMYYKEGVVGKHKKYMYYMKVLLHQVHRPQQM